MSEAARRARMTFWWLMAATVLFGAASAAWYSDRKWLAVGLGAVMVLCICIPGLLFDQRDEETARWGEDGVEWSMSDAEFEALVDHVDRSAASAVVSHPLEASGAEQYFAGLVRDAIDELPDFVRHELDRNVAVLAVDGGDRPDVYGSSAHAVYGLYVGWTAAEPDQPARILLFRDTLMSSFADAESLKEQVGITLRHEIAHHFGADEPRVRELGL